MAIDQKALDPIKCGMIKLIVKCGCILAIVLIYSWANAQTPPVTGKYWSVVVDTKAVSVAKATATLAGVFNIGPTTSTIKMTIYPEGKIRWADGSISTSAYTSGGSGGIGIIPSDNPIYYSTWSPTALTTPQQVISLSTITASIFYSSGAFCTMVINQSGHVLSLGEVLESHPDYDNAVTTSSVSDIMPIGVCASSNVAIGEYFPMAVSGKARVLLENGSAGVRGYFMGTSDSAVGRAVATATPPATTQHDQEIGHCLEAVSAGAGKTALCILHFR